MAVRVWSLALGLQLLVTSAMFAGPLGPGVLDPSFGRGGESAIQGNVQCLKQSCIQFDGSIADTIVVEHDGRILLGGWNSLGNPGIAGSSLVRLGADGELETSFGSEGRSSSTPGVRIVDIHVFDHGALLAIVATEAGRIGLQHYANSGAPENPVVADARTTWLMPETASVESTATVDVTGRVDVFSENSQGEAKLARFWSSGTPDMGFGTGGTMRLRAFGGARGVTIASEQDGAILIAGIDHRTLVERVTSAGKTDLSFGHQGIIYPPLQLDAKRGVLPSLVLGVSPNRHVMLAADEVLKDRTGEGGKLLVFDYTRVGRLVGSFGKGGVVQSALPRNPRLFSRVEPRAIAFDSATGEAIVVGERPEPRRDHPGGRWFLARYTANGSDCSFGSHGMVLGTAAGGANAVTVQPDGRILIAGWIESPGDGHDLMVSRYAGGGRGRTCSSET